MIDIEVLRTNPDLVRESQRRRFADVGLVDLVLNLDERWIKTDYASQQCRKEKNKLSKEFGMRRRKGEPTDDLTVALDELKTTIEEKTAEAEALLKERDIALVKIGNLLHDSVIVSADEDENGVEKVTHTPEQLEEYSATRSHNHVELFDMADGFDTLRGVKVAGNRGYFLKSWGVRLNQALMLYAMDFLQSKGFCPMSTPFFMEDSVMAKCAQLEQFREELYKVSGEGEDKFLIATSEQPLCALHMDEWFTAEDLAEPIKYAGVSTCFRKEAGRHGADTLGIFRIHQFEKVEQFVITSPEEGKSWEAFDMMIANAQEFYDTLKLPYRVVSIVSKELNNAAAKKLDLEAYFPASKCFRELVSCSNCLDYQSRRLGIKFGKPSKTKKGKKDTESKGDFVHLLNATLTATERTMCCIVENYQDETGIVVPEPLRKYMGGMEHIDFVRTKPRKGFEKVRAMKDTPTQKESRKAEKK
eukprot:gnl/Carplike_NY0171/557_a760_1663.p1 GENE.gnl/Carplike_NY0171/557_a760_1663~~gnl/Carplike_NY0171/557_a760_1663.p1  ORF type:complete len:473 (+),score=179.34 gnl/Carplike_NY0171/557_a760_1663:63-1481(+)